MRFVRLPGLGRTAVLLGIAMAIGPTVGNGLTQESSPMATPERSCAPMVTATPEGAAMPTERDKELIEAARGGDTATVKRLLTEGASVSAQDATGQTALIAAAWGNHLDAACALIAAGADVNVQDDTQQSAYLIATSEGYLELLEMTLDAGADVHSLDSYNGTGLIRAAERGHFDVVARLLETDIAVDHINRLGLTALLEAVMFGDGGPRYVETIRLLLAAGADVNLADSNGATPLAHARQRGFTEIAALLENAGGR
jgi:ankyrin repeat protein